MKVIAYYFAIALLSLTFTNAGWGVESQLAVPSKIQYDWHEQERIMFLCLDPCCWQGREYDNHTTKLSQMKLEKLDVEQWMAAAKAWGAKEILFVCKHTGGFCWWPTETTDYCVKNIPWKNGKGNLVKDVADACQRHGLKMGVYIYSDDPRFAKHWGKGGRTDDPKKQEQWNKLLRKQWEEVLTICGPDLVNEIWFDGSCVVPLEDIVKRLAPNAVILQSPLGNIRWVGNERGIATDPNWNTLSLKDLKSGVATQKHSTPDGNAWAPVECDTTLYDHFWFWSPRGEKKRKSLDTLMATFIQSAGRGSVLLLNSTPNTSGLIPDGDMILYKEFGETLRHNFEHPLGKVEELKGFSAEIDLGGVKKFNCADLWEDYRLGHRIRAYSIEAHVNGQWKKIAEGTAVGRRKIDMFTTVQADRVRLRITQAVLEPVIRRFQLHMADDKLIAAFQKKPAKWHKIGNWNAGQAELRISLTHATVEPRIYTIRLNAQRGTSRVEILSAEYWSGGSKMPADQLRLLGKNTVEINRSQVLPPGTPVELRLTLKSKAGSKGIVELQ